MSGRLLAAALALLVGCQPGAGAQVPALPASAPAASEEAVAAAVRSRLARDADLAGLAISVEVAGGRVRLRGVAPSTALRARITALARQVGGSFEVVNEVSVQPRPT